MKKSFLVLALLLGAGFGQIAVGMSNANPSSKRSMSLVEKTSALVVPMATIGICVAWAYNQDPMLPALVGGLAANNLYQNVRTLRGSNNDIQPSFSKSIASLSIPGAFFITTGIFGSNSISDSNDLATKVRCFTIAGALAGLGLYETIMNFKRHS